MKMVILVTFMHLRLCLVHIVCLYLDSHISDVQ